MSGGARVPREASGHAACGACALSVWTRSRWRESVAEGLGWVLARLRLSVGDMSDCRRLSGVLDCVPGKLSQRGHQQDERNKGSDGDDESVRHQMGVLAGRL